ncbi:MAG: aminoglycoside phosphotransferase family protein [Burkholderiales bacterium]|nr:aminoglycoside phosphotransferase family protein [Burkholderiales bacterium]
MAGLAEQLRAAGLIAAGVEPTLTPLTGGVSSDIALVEADGARFCVKRALAQLRVAADWRAPVERNRSEVAWMRFAGRVVPGAVPDVLAERGDEGWFAMRYLDPERHPLWKSELRDGRIDAAFAGRVGATLARVHAASAADASLPARFATDHIFVPIRLEPYLAATALRHPDCARRLHGLIDATLANRHALVHGDVSPKNILVGPDGPVFLDAECAWWGDPAFDLAFCLNHLLLKCVWRPQWTAAYLESFGRLAADYLAGVTWEGADALDGRAAGLLAGLMLARIDGKSPVEYITAAAERERVRGFARRFLAAPAARVGALAQAWGKEMAS